MGFQLEHYVFTAKSTSTTLMFFGDPETRVWGPVIADVSVTVGAQCKNDGWQSLIDPITGVAFANQGQCVSYFAKAGYVPIGSSNSSWLNLN